MSPPDPPTTRARLAGLFAPARDGPGGPEGRVEQWLPGAGKHRAGAARDVVRSVGPGVQRRRLAMAVAVVAVVLATVVAVLVRAGPDAERAPALPAAGASSAPASVSARPLLVVSVVGKVRRPGLVEVRAGARVADALEAAGGPRRGVDLTTINLARKVVDGEQIHVGVPSAAAPADGGGAGAPPGKINLNTANAQQLEELPGVGEVTASSILDWRARHGGFTAVEQLREVDGIGERRLAALRDLVTV